MRTQHSLSSLNIPGVSREMRVDFACGKSPPRPAPKAAILLVSEDNVLGESLRCAAGEVGRLVLRAAGLSEALGAVQSGQLAAVLLDLDLPSEAAWVVADGLLQEPDCPPLILLTGRRDQFDMSTAIRAGSLVDKSSSFAKLLELVDRELALPDLNRTERNAIQRVVIRWLRPCAWPVSVTPSYRHWGINE
jgi:DNA-binding NtrC family response regulator